MFLNDDAKVINISIPKTGSTSLHYALGEATGEHFEFDNQAPALYHMYANDIIKIIGRERWDDFYSFSVVRNPYDRMVSLFCDFKYQRNAISLPDFPSFIKLGLKKNWLPNVHFHPQANFISDVNGVVVKDVFRFESGMQSVCAALSEKTGIKKIAVGHARKSDRTAWQDYYKTNEEIEIVNEIYQKDFEVFEYPMLSSVLDL